MFKTILSIIPISIPSIKGIDGILNPRLIVGASSGNIATLMRSYEEGKLVAPTSPWDFLFPLSVIKPPKHVGDITLKRYFKKFEQWPDGRFLLQLKDGIDYLICGSDVAAAKLIGMRSVVELYE